MDNTKAKSKLENHLSGSRANKWLILVTYPTKYLGHAQNIHYNSNHEKLEFVDSHGDIVDHIRNGDGREVSWGDFNFQNMDQFFLFTYRKGVVEWSGNNKQESI